MLKAAGTKWKFQAYRSEVRRNQDQALLAPGGLIYDLKAILPPSASNARI